MSAAVRMWPRMVSNRNLCVLVNIGLCLLTGVYLLAQKPSSSAHAGKAASGRSTFNNACAACHGLDGRGSDKGVNISGSEKVGHLTDAQLSEIISDGVPGTGMPAFHTLSPNQLRTLITYVR